MRSWVGKDYRRLGQAQRAGEGGAGDRIAPATRGDDERPHSPDPTVTHRAKQVCAGCPVRVQCLAHVMATETPTQRRGVTGGLSADERVTLYRTRHGAAPARVIGRASGVRPGRLDPPDGPTAQKVV